MHVYVYILFDVKCWSMSSWGRCNSSWYIILMRPVQSHNSLRRPFWRFEVPWKKLHGFFLQEPRKNVQKLFSQYCTIYHTIDLFCCTICQIWQQHVRWPFKYMHIHSSLFEDRGHCFEWTVRLGDLHTAGLQTDQGEYRARDMKFSCDFDRLEVEPIRNMLMQSNGFFSGCGTYTAETVHVPLVNMLICCLKIIVLPMKKALIVGYHAWNQITQMSHPPDILSDIRLIPSAHLSSSTQISTLHSHTVREKCTGTNTHSCT